MRLDFRRRRGSTVQVINIQPSAERMENANVFYVNIGVAFDELWQHFGIAVPEKPMEYDCHFRTRLEGLLPDCPQWWVISGDSSTTQFFKQVSRLGGREIASNDEEVDKVTQLLAILIQKAVSELNKIDSPQTFLAHPWRNEPHGGNTMLNPLLSYVIGDLGPAWSELANLSKRFSDRPRMSVAELVSQLRLEKLRGKLLDND